jgi:arylsulfatase A-like enzyme
MMDNVDRRMNNKRQTTQMMSAAVAAGMTLFGGISAVKAVPQPNIVHILTDDLGWQDIACYYRALHGEESVYETPHMDRLAQNGKRFMQAYSPAPTCAPSRAAYMAGQYTPRTGVFHVMGGRPARVYNESHAYIDPFYSGRLKVDTPIIADVLKDAGYTTAHIQKWHFGGRSKGFPGPLDYGFDFSWGWQALQYNDPELYDPNDKKTADYEGIWRPTRPDRISDFASSYDPKAPYALDPNDDDRPFDAVVDLSVRWMDKVKDQGKPFFMNFCPSFVHGPFCTRDRKRLEYYCEKMGVPFPTDPGRIADKAPGFKNPYYAAMLDSLDWQVGRILSFLETTDDPRNPGHKLIDNTYIMVSSDNGGLENAPILDGRDKGKPERITDNTPLRGGKLKIFEGGIRIPFIIQGPGIEAGSVCDTPINLIDLFPTYMAMAGAEPETELDLDGCNILPVMLGDESDAMFADGTARDTLFWHYPSVMPSSSIIRKGGWKLRLNHAPELNRLPPIMLYKLYNDDGSPCDLGEADNLADAEPQRRDALLAELNAWLAKYDAPLPYRNSKSSLPGADKVPAVIRRQTVKERVELHVETGAGKAKVVEARLVYTTNGSPLLQHKRQEEWFEVPAEINAGVASAAAPPGMTHGIFYLRDENGFLILSEPLAPYTGTGASSGIGVDLIQDGYAYRPGLLSLINLAVSAGKSAKATGQDVAALNGAIKSARAVVAKPVEEQSYALAMRALRREIKALDVPQAKRPVMNQFATEKW